MGALKNPPPWVVFTYIGYVRASMAFSPMGKLSGKSHRINEFKWGEKKGKS